MKKIKLLFLINTLNTGGAERVLIDLLHHLDPDNFDCELLCVSSGPLSAEAPDHVHVRTLTARLPRRLQALGARLIYKLPPQIFRLFFLKNSYDIEIAYLQGFPTHMIATHRTDARKIAFLHSDVSATRVLDSLYKNVGRCAEEYRLFDRVCFVSQDAMEGFIRTVGPLPNLRVVHNVIDTNRIKALADVPLPSPDYSTAGLKIISVGRLAAPKRFDRLVEIAAELETAYDFEIWIVGDGPERAALQQRISDRHCRSVRLLGHFSNPYPLMKKADLYLCSSAYEGFSTSVFEARCLGLPVLTTKCSGMSEILEGGRYGIIVPNETKALAAGLRRVLQEPSRLHSLIGTEQSCAKLTQNALREYEALFKELIQ